MSQLSVEQIHQYVKDLGNEDDDALLDLLAAVERCQMTYSLLKSTSIGKVVGKLKKSTNPKVAEIATRVVTNWKKLIPTAAHDSSKSVSNSTALTGPTKLHHESQFMDLREFLSSRIVSPSLEEMGYFYKSIAFDGSRMRTLSPGNNSLSGPVIFLLTRDQRLSDNWALIRSQEVAISKSSALFIVFCLVPSFLNGNIRQRGFMLRNLKLMEHDAMKLNIPFFLLLGEPKDLLPDFLSQYKVSHIVTDFSPLRIITKWNTDIISLLQKKTEQAKIPFEQVDAHNICPSWVISSKCEFSAKTIRTKIHNGISSYLTEFPELLVHPHTYPGLNLTDSSNSSSTRSTNKWIEALDLMSGRPIASGVDSSSFYDVPEITWCLPGEREAKEALKRFVARLDKYGDDRNNPVLVNGVSNLSPYIRFGHISVQRILLEIKRAFNITNKSLFPEVRTTGIHSFCEEVVVRRELSDNFCLYNVKYDSIEGAHSWAQKTLREHWNDVRPVVYTAEQLEAAVTADDLWNAAQLEMVSCPLRSRNALCVCVCVCDQRIRTVLGEAHDFT